MSSSGKLNRMALVRTDVFGGICGLHHHDEKIQRARNNVNSN
jgi:hypothetical protein